MALRHCTVVENWGDIGGSMPTNDPVDVFKYYDMRGDDECWTWNGGWNGYSPTRRRRPYFMAGGKRKIAYRWVYELVHGVELTPEQLIRHSCDRGDYPVGCGNPSHLSIGTVQDNSNDMTAHERHGLPHHVVKAIRNLLSQGVTQQEVADRYGVSRECIRDIGLRDTYRHIPD